MKSLKIYLIVVSVLLCIAIGLGVYVWYALQQLNTDMEKAGVTQVETKKETTEAPSETTTPVAEPVIIQTKNLPAAQQKIVEGLGYTEGTITFTSAMILCAEDAIGKERVQEIVEGATPNPIESVSLIPCLKK